MVVLSLATVALLATRLTTTTAAATPERREILNVAIPNGFVHCLFYDDFTDPPGSPPSSSRWTFDLGTSYPGGPPNWGTGETQTYTNDSANIHITDDCTLRITPIKLADGTWTSSRIETTEEWDFGARKGEIVRAEARIRLGTNPKSTQLGIWPAFWALGSPYRGNYQNWPAVGEIDILENVNSEPKIWQVTHCGYAPGGPCNEFNGLSHVTEPVERGAWYTVAWELDRRPSWFPWADREERMNWYVDGKKSFTIKESDIADDAAWEGLAENCKFLLLNVAVGGGFPDGVAGFKTPTEDTVGGEGASMEVDYVAVYSRKY
ncbi:hypothetical protein K4F52_008963 [Lecanicillium sp. MT-2017a]|nr:hypothetical protein K4F52_008963 [Lecanicillium sp. MT-2017a]